MFVFFLPFLKFFSCYNEDRNLLRIKERERRNQEVHQEKEPFLECAPLFGEPYKTSKGDELSSWIQSMLGNYEEVKELISNRSHQNLIGIPKSALPLTSQGKTDRLSLPDRTHPPFHNPQHSGGPPSATAPGSCPVQYQKRPASSGHSSSQQSKSYSLSSNSWSQGPDLSQGNQEMQSNSSSGHQRKSDRWPDLEECAKLPMLLSALSPPSEPLSPLHSFEPSDSEAPGREGHRKSPLGDPVTMSIDGNKRDVHSSVSVLSEAGPLPSQTFLPALPSKINPVMQQKPTAYVRPMDGQDQAPNESPELKPPPEDYHEQSYGNFSDLKTNAKVKLSKLKIPSQPIETLSNEAHCVEDILREMTHSWPPPLTAIHTPSTAEPSKFPFPAKESQHVHCGFVGQKHYDSSSKVPPSNCQQGSSAPQSSSVALAHSSDGESESLSESHSTSGSETESESSSSENEEEEREPKKSPPVPEVKPVAPTANKWQLDNWLVKVNQQCSHPESQSDPAQSHIEESRVQDSNGDNPEESLKSNESCPPHEESSRESGVIQDISHSKGSRQKSPAHRAGISQRQSFGKKQPCKSAKVPRPEECRGDLKVESEPAPPKGKDQSSTEKPKVKTKNGHEKPSKKTETGKPPKRVPSEKKKRKEPTATLKPALDSHCEREGRAVCSRLPQAESQPPSAVRTSADKAVNQVEDCLRKGGALTPIGDGRLLSPLRDVKAPQALVVKIQLSLLSRVPQPPGKGSHQKKTALPKPSVERKKEAGKLTLDIAPPKVHKKRQAVENEKSLGIKRPKLDTEIKPLSSNPKSPGKSKVSKSASKKMKKVLVPPPVSPAQGPPKGAGYKRCSSESSTAGACNAKSSHVGPSSVKHKKTQQKHTEHSKSSKKSSQNSSTPFPVPSLPNESSKPARPLQKFDNKQYPVEHHIKEAKKLKHKADVMSDKVGKAFSYLDAALSFIESGISMESNPQTPKSAYTMFSETVDLIKFIVKLKNFVDPSAPAPERIFAVLCMRCQSLLHMAMFRYKKETALKHSRTLTEHFKSSSRSAQAPSPCVARSSGTPSPMSPMPSPASSAGSVPGSSLSNGGSTGMSVTIPQMINQVASSYISITSLFLTAHDIWEQADALAKKNNEFFVELDSAMGPLSLTTSMSALVRFTRQGLHWLRLDTNMP
ncbi:AF4/FMR2 family member 1-like isoform X1 [Acipenser oxyrinchus oxyrinchus]|uniref:AF4/FMR2 family member 1-like isoform X1 n=1 Tax=Acipenser oxyrinchus oxyrinchus TaxID=40147 RepID=A0AAD8GH23_ACIOX|nr:AF4/FMR2 family member 1-like isoform X1 [Acipenser oxyrinchus oxyrinchus]